MASKLTELKKKEIIAGFVSGKTLSALAKEYGCTPSTITRTVKSSIGNDEYAQLINRKKRRGALNPVQSELKSDSSNSSNEKSLINTEQYVVNQGETVLDSVELKSENHNNDLLTEIIPLNSEQTWDKQKEVACLPLDNESLPQIVYMLVDKKVELDSKPLKEFSEWSFLPAEDQERFAIPLFSNQRAAKRSCSRTQRVLKVPDSKVFIISSSYLLSKGITRLIIDDSLIALDNNAH